MPEPSESSLFDQPADKFERRLRFPSDKSIGMIYVTEDDSVCLSGCEYAEAMGDVVVQVVPGENIGLWVEDTDLSPLAALDPNALQWLHLEAAADDNLPFIKNLTGLRELIISSFDFPDVVSDIGVTNIKNMRKLRSLTFHDVGITDAALKTVASLPALRSLVLSKVTITDEGLSHLSQTKLQELALYELSLTDKAVPALASIKSLKQLNLWRAGLSPNAIRQLTQLLPKTKVTGLGPKPENF